MLFVDSTGKPLHLIPARQSDASNFRDLRYILNYLASKKSNEKGETVVNSLPPNVSTDNKNSEDTNNDNKEKETIKKKHHIKDSSKPDPKILDQVQDRKRI